MVELYGLCTSACMQVVCRQQNLDTTEDNRNTFTHPLRTAEIYLSKYFSTADSRNKYTLQLLHLPPTAESKLHLYLTKSRTSCYHSSRTAKLYFKPNFGTQSIDANKVKRFAIAQLNTFDMDKGQTCTPNAHRLHS